MIWFTPAQLGRVLPSDAPDGVSGGRVQSDGGSSDGVWHFHKKTWTFWIFKPQIPQRKIKVAAAPFFTESTKRIFLSYRQEGAERSTGRERTCKGK